MDKVDLHVHTTASDGTETPSQLVRLAAQSGLKAVAITDHDTELGCYAAIEAGKKYGVEVIPGIEISTKYETAVHIVGHCLDIDSPVLRSITEWEVHDRDERNEKICELMRADGLPVQYSEMQERFGIVVGRPHFARILVEFGLAESIADAFKRLVGKGMRYYCPRNHLSISKSIETITAAGGVAIIAHPFQYKLDDDGLRRLIRHCMVNGLRGMECRYSGYTEEQSAYLEALADEYGLLKSGGSDFHGSNKPHISLGTGTGDMDVPYEWLERIKEAAGN